MQSLDYSRKYADLVSLRNWVTLDDMIRGASEISTGKYSTMMDMHGSGETYRELGLAISSYLGNREVNFDLELVRGFIKGRDRKSTRLNSSHSAKSRMPSSA